jgi:hypothetical protein
MSQQPFSKPQSDRIRLASYLTVGLAGALMATVHSEAAVVNIDLTNVQGNNITATNGGVTSGQRLDISDWLGAGTGTLRISNNFYNFWGLGGTSDLEFAYGGAFATPRNFVYGSSIDASASASWSGSGSDVNFRSTVGVSPDFGAGSFMGFRFGSAGNYNYGYLEVTWTGATNTFQILSGAYETAANTAITTPSAVPGAGLSAMALMALGGGGAFRRRSRGRVA